jgi:hypothetical protein
MTIPIPVDRRLHHRSAPGREPPEAQALDPALSLPGEDLETVERNAAFYWMCVYGELLRFQERLVARFVDDAPRRSGADATSAADALSVLERACRQLEARLYFWRRRLLDAR